MQEINYKYVVGLLVKEWGVYTQVDQQKAGWGPGDKTNLSINDWHTCVTWSWASSMRLVVYGSDTFSKDAAHEESIISSGSSQWKKLPYSMI